MNTLKRQHGVYYTEGNPFLSIAFRQWGDRASISSTTILEPFAGANSLIAMLKEMGLCNKSKSFDIHPDSPQVSRRDTLSCFPTGYSVCITNPPWLAKNSATVRGLAFPDTPHDDLYKVALEACLDNCQWVAALVPESFIRSGLYHDRLSHFVSLTDRLFSETGHPVGLALFDAMPSKEVMVWRDNELIGMLSMLEKCRPLPIQDGISVRFNETEGNVGLVALDNTISPSIRFCDPSELSGYVVKQSGRHITKMFVDGDVRIDEWNDCLASFRAITQDVLLTSYKGIRKDGYYRRRCDWNIARGIIHYVN